jgi:hypothetical protein
MNNKFSILLTEYIRRITESLSKEGFSEEQIIEIIKDLENNIYDAMSEDLTDNMLEEDISDINDTDTDKLKNPKEIANLLGVSEDDISINFLHRLEKFLKDIPHNTSSLKEKYQTKQNTSTS